MASSGTQNHRLSSLPPKVRGSTQKCDSSRRNKTKNVTRSAKQRKHDVAVTFLGRFLDSACPNLTRALTAMILTGEIVMFGFFVVVCALGSQGKPSLSLRLPGFNIFGVFGHPREVRQANLKKYSGERVKNDSLRMVYFYDQTVAVVELGANKLLLNCELVEV